LHECLKAHDQLKGEGVNVRVFDPFTIKPIDAEGLIQNAQACGGNVVVVEDHYPEGGVAEAVCGALSMTRNVRVHRLAVNAMPRSGPPMDLMDMFGISARSVVAAAREMMA